MQDEALDFRAIDSTFRPRVRRYLRHLVGERDAEDLTQMVMVKVSDGLAHFRGDSQLSTWIYRIATNTALDRLRSPAFQAEAESIAPGELDRVVEQQIPSTEATAIRGEMNACIREFIERLPASHRAMIVLGDLEGFKNREIAEILGLSLATVKIRLYRAREKLKQDLAAACTLYRDERNELACERKPSTDCSAS